MEVWSPNLKLDILSKSYLELFVFTNFLFSYLQIQLW